jgi:hypothetical protein
MTTIEEIKAQLGSLTVRQITRDKASIIIDQLTDFVESISVGSSSNFPSNTVTSETYFGITPSAGNSSNYSRGDHTHGTPTVAGSYLPTTAFGGLNKITVGSGSPGSPTTGDLWIDIN